MHEFSDPPAESCARKYPRTGIRQAVYLRRFAGAASCSVEEQPLKVIALEHFAQVNRPRSYPPLPWMRTSTLYDEVAKSYRRYSKNMSIHLEDAIIYLASILRELIPQLLREVQESPQG